MSRTYKDKPSRVRYPTQSGYSWYTRSQPPRGAKPLLPKKEDTECHWMTTPSWFRNMFHTRPQRHKNSTWEREVVKAQSLEDLENEDPPPISNKPEKYYW